MSPDRRRWAVRIAWAVAGLVWFVWLGAEDRGPATAIGVSVVLATAWGLSTAREALTRAPWRLPLVGLAAGSAVGPLAALLMLIKTSIHAHPVPDFTPEDLRAAISRLPLWAGVGLLLGVAGVLLAAARRAGPGETGEAGEVQSVMPRRDDDG